jgi:hypothetical protein
MSDRYRVVVAFEASSDAAAATREAVQLAELLSAELFGVFVEEIEALHLAALPFAALIDKTGRRTPLRAATVEAAWKSAASRAESGLSSAARSARIPASFGVARGRLLAELRALSRVRDVILLGEKRAPVPMPGPVVVIARSHDTAMSLLPVAEALGGSRALRVVLPADGDEPPVSESGKSLVVRRSESFDAESLGDLLRTTAARLAIVSADEPWLDDRALGELRRRAGCPVALVRSG